MNTKRSGKSTRESTLTVLCITLLAFLVIVPSAQAKRKSAPGDWTQADVNHSVTIGVAYIDSKFNTTQGHWPGTGSIYIGPIPTIETGMALIAYNVLATGNFSSLSPSYQAHLTAAVLWLLSQQQADGSWGDGGGLTTYGTGIILGGLSWLQNIPGVPPTAVPTAIAKGRDFLINKDFNGTVRTGCSLAPPPPPNQTWWCGGWTYTSQSNPEESDESDVGFAIFGLQLTGGVPTAPINVAGENTVWQSYIQTISSNPYAMRNDGGGSYNPFETSGEISSNANDTGTMLFSYGYDGVPGTDARVAAGLLFAQDVLDSYEENPHAFRMIYHTGKIEDGSCLPDSTGCDWKTGNITEGGFHYSMFSLAKGMGWYLSPSLIDPNNWYAKIVDLLLTQQNSDGSWPVDGRDDATDIVAAAFSILPLGCLECTGYIEICKASDPNHPVTGTFIFDATTPGFHTTPISVPVGQCSGSVKVPSGAVTVTERPVIGVAVSGVTAIGYDELGFRHDELDSWIVPDLNALVNVMPGDQDEETLTTFTNYAAPPGIFKLCKIAGDQFTLGHPFVFTVTINNQSTDYTITAGPAQQGGYCKIVGSPPVNTQVQIKEHAQFLFPIEGITVNEGQLMACTPPSDYCTIATTIPGITEVDFTNGFFFQKRCMECENLK